MSAPEPGTKPANRLRFLRRLDYQLLAVLAATVLADVMIYLWIAQVSPSGP